MLEYRLKKPQNGIENRQTLHTTRKKKRQTELNIPKWLFEKSKFFAEI